MLTQEEKVDAFKKLVERFGEEAVADALLAKWLADNESTESWMRLAAACGMEIPERPPSHNNAWAEKSGRMLSKTYHQPYLITQRARLSTARV